MKRYLKIAVIAGVAVGLVAALANIPDMNGNTFWMLVTGRAEFPEPREYAATVDKVEKEPFGNIFGSTQKLHVGLRLDAGGYIVVLCMDGLSDNLAECFGLEPGDRVRAYGRESGSWGIRRQR